MKILPTTCLKHIVRLGFKPRRNPPSYDQKKWSMLYNQKKWSMLAEKVAWSPIASEIVNELMLLSYDSPFLDNLWDDDQTMQITWLGEDDRDIETVLLVVRFADEEAYGHLAAGRFEQFMEVEDPDQGVFLAVSDPEFFMEFVLDDDESIERMRLTV